MMPELLFFVHNKIVPLHDVHLFFKGTVYRVAFPMHFRAE